MPIKSKIRTIKNYPIDGVMFRDITNLFNDPDGLSEAINIFAQRYKDMKIDKINAIDLFPMTHHIESIVRFIPKKKN